MSLGAPQKAASSCMLYEDAVFSRKRGLAFFKEQLQVHVGNT